MSQARFEAGVSVVRVEKCWMLGLRCVECKGCGALGAKV